MKIKAFLTTALLTVMVLGLISCTGSQPAAEPGGASDTTGGESDEGSGAQEAESASDETVSLNFWYIDSGPLLNGGMDTLVKSFEEAHPNIELTVDAFPRAEYFQKIATAAAAGTAPDVFWVGNTRIAEYAYYETLLPLDDLITEEDRADYFELALEDSSYQGQLLSLPLHQSTEAILYNEDLIAAAGLNPPKEWSEAWTWDEFLDALHKVTQRSGDTTEVWGYGTEYPPGDYNSQPWIVMHGGSFVSPDGSTFVGYLDSPETLAALDWWTGLYRDEKVAPIDRTPDMFPTGKVAFWQSNPFVLRDIENRYPDFNVGVMPMPCDVTCSVPGGGFNIGIYANTQHPDEAWQLVEWITSPEGHKVWIETTGYLPARKSTYEELDWVKEYPWNVFMEGINQYGTLRPQTPAYSVFSDELQQKMINDVALGADVEAKAAEAVQIIEAEHQRFQR